MTYRIFKRKIYDKLLEWKENYSNETALLLKGARRIGKTTIVEEFAKNEYESYLIIDFSNTSKEINDLFLDIYDLDYFFLKLQLLSGVDLIEKKSVIIFDEVQLQPLARQAIKHLVKDGRYHYIETGSLLSIKKNIKDILIPSEETRINMYPMDFEEFLLATGDSTTYNLIKKAFKSGKSLGDDVNRKLLRDFRLYILVGGMPQAVNEYIESKNFSKVDRVKRNILDLYEEDFRKIDPSGKASLFFKEIPAQLSKGSGRYKPSSVDKNSRLERVEELIQDILDSMTVNISYHANDPNVGMSITKDTTRFKLFIMDTGLFVTLAFMDKDFTENTIYEKILSNKLSANLGYVYENAIAQILKTKGDELFYYTMDNEKHTNKYKIDFLISRKHKICPIEVKSSAYKTHKSLDVFSKKYSARIDKKYLLYTKDYKKYGEVIMLPIYMTDFL